jgi:serine protease Do
MDLRGVAVFDKGIVCAVGDDGTIAKQEGGLVLSGRRAMPVGPMGQPPAAYLGIRPEPKQAEGFPVGTVEPDGPADKAGIKAGDLIVSFDGKPVKSPMELINIIRDKKPGDEVELEVKRGEETKKIKATMGKRG